MPFSEADHLPSYAELEVEEINMTAAPLRAGAHHFGKYCDHQSKEFMLCVQEEKDPRKCLGEGKEVTRCAMDFFQRVKSTCAEEFTKYYQCVDHSGSDMDLRGCRKTQKVFDKCMLEHFNQERPELGYFSKVRVHNSTRPRPQRNIPMPEPTPGPTDPRTQPVPESAKYGTRAYFFP